MPDPCSESKFAASPIHSQYFTRALLHDQEHDDVPDGFQFQTKEGLPRCQALASYAGYDGPAPVAPASRAARTTTSVLRSLTSATINLSLMPGLFLRFGRARVAPARPPGRGNGVSQYCHYRKYAGESNKPEPVNQRAPARYASCESQSQSRKPPAR